MAHTNPLTPIAQRFGQHPDFAPLLAQLADAPTPEGLAQLCDRLEGPIWSQPFDDALLDSYQQLFRYRETLIAARPTADPRPHFTLVIPVADRPRQLEHCLHSLLQLCERYAYGGRDERGYRKVKVILADDSRQPSSIRRHQQLAETFTAAGLISEYFGQPQQLALIQTLPPHQAAALAGIIGSPPAGDFSHKGAAVMRNITYLKLASRIPAQASELIYFIDSDQEFRVPVHTADGPAERYAINYLHQLERIFSQPQIRLVTGKVVGDPPVSPAVMAAGILADLYGLVTELARLPPHDPCSLPHQQTAPSDQAAYHDMAELFGFTPAQTPYHCELSAPHRHLDSLNHLASRLARFFDGQHPTRKTPYHHQAALDSLQPARTIYSGNYLLRADALDYFIPFAPLKLRMAGPALGRILQAEIGAAFVSAHLPMLHRRSLEELEGSEFRPGVRHDATGVDLSDEFVRQFFGDLMLFTIHRLSAQGYPQRPPQPADLERALEDTETQLLERYRQQQQQIAHSLSALQQEFATPSHWWWQEPSATQACQQIGDFLRHMNHNFGPQAEGYARIQSPSERQTRRDQIRAAIRAYPDLRQSWAEIIHQLRPTP